MQAASSKQLDKLWEMSYTRFSAYFEGYIEFEESEEVVKIDQSVWEKLGAKIKDILEDK